MNKVEVCEVLKIKENQLARLVRINQIALRDGDYDDTYVEHLRQQAILTPGVALTKLPAKRTFRNERVTRARFDLIAALKGAVLTSGMTCNEAQGSCAIW
jgi:hypothetical protein